MTASTDGMATRLSHKAAALAEAAIASRRLGSNVAARWRSARLLWPLFTQRG